MKIVSAYKDNWIDPPVMKIMDHVQYTSLDFTAVVVTIKKGYEFNPELNNIKGPWVLFDFCEYGWDWDMKHTHIFGCNPDKPNYLTNYKAFNTDLEEWKKFDNFCNINPPIVYFKRESLLYSFGENHLIPIEYPCFHEIPAPDSFNVFTARPIEVSFLWGDSHPLRTELHIDMLKLSTKLGIHLLNNVSHINGCFNDVPAGERRVWLSEKVPHYARYSMEDVLYVGLLSKFSVSMPGAGLKCFRHAESSVNSIMAMPYGFDAEWSYPWVSGVNCIKFSDAKDLYSLLTKKYNASDLYEIYVRGISTARNYQIENYVTNHILKTIENA